MNANSTLRRTIYTLGAAATLGLVLAGPADAKPEPGEPVVTGHPGTTSPRVIEVPIDDNAIEILQLGGGVLAGLALAGAGMAAASRRQHADPHPA